MFAGGAKVKHVARSLRRPFVHIAGEFFVRLIELAAVRIGNVGAYQFHAALGFCQIEECDVR